MQLGDTIIKISEFLSQLWSWIEQLFTYQFTIGNLNINIWSIFLGLGVSIFITVLIIRVFT